MTREQKTTYTIYTCDLCDKKQSEELAKFTLQDYGKIDKLVCCIWEKHICQICTRDIYNTVKRIRNYYS